MLTLAQQGAFVAEQLARLGGWLELPALERHGQEIAAAAALKAELEKSVADVDFFRTKHWDGMLRLGLYRCAQYALTRSTGARTTVETGVLHGLSTVFCLAALSRNAEEAGAEVRAVSIDLPSVFEVGPANDDGYVDTLPPGLQPGWLIPQTLRRLWRLRVGSSRQELPATCAELGAVDLFVHDSEHTYETMMFEFETVWPYLASGGVVIADNIDANTAFFDFARAQGVWPHVMPVDPDHYTPGASGLRFGVLRK